MRCKITAFSLIELLVAISLATMLMVALGGLSVSAKKTEKMFTAIDTVPNWADRFYDLLYWELRNSQKVECTDDKMTIYGMASLTKGKLAPDHRSAKIVYFLKGTQDRQHLIRVQEYSNDLTNQNRTSDIVATDIRSFHVFFCPPNNDKNNPGKQIAIELKLSNGYNLKRNFILD